MLQTLDSNNLLLLFIIKTLFNEMITAKDKKVPIRKTHKPRGENAENSFIIYCEFKTVLTDQVRANKHKINIQRVNN